jgi:hypothetical protein
MAYLGGTRPSAAGLRLRFRVWRGGPRLDAALADGTDPTSDPALALRARQLTGASSRNAMANTIRNVLDAVDEPREAWAHGGPRPPLQTDAIIAARDRLETLADELRQRPRVKAQTAALASLLLWDSASPLYSPCADATVEAWTQTLYERLGAASPSPPL